jgi:hypothetical protein
LAAVAEAEFRYSDLLPTGADDTPYPLITTEEVSTVEGPDDRTSKTDPAHWRSFAVVRDAVRRFGGYPYLVVTPDDPYALIDFDKCCDPLTGELTPWVCGYLDRLGTYSEVSTSGTGVRAVVKSDRHFKSCKAAKMDGRAVEVYAHGHGCIMTGKTLDYAPIRGDVDEVLDELRADVAPVATPRATTRKYRGPESRSPIGCRTPAASRLSWLARGPKTTARTRATPKPPSGKSLTRKASAVVFGSFACTAKS